MLNNLSKDILHQFQIMLDATAFHALLQPAEDQGFATFDAFFKATFTPKSGMRHFCTLGFIEKEYTKVDLSGALMMMSPNIALERVMNGDMYLPNFSIGLMDRKGNIASSHIECAFRADMLNWNLLGAQQSTSIPLAAILDGCINDVLTNLVSPDISQGDKSVYSTRDPLTINITTMMLGIGAAEGPARCLLIRGYLVVDEIKPAILKHERALVYQGDDVPAELEKRQIHSVSYARYLKHAAAIDMPETKHLTLRHAVSKMATKQINAAWFEETTGIHVSQEEIDAAEPLPFTEPEISSS